MNSIKYYLLLLAALPCLPFMVWEGKRIRKNIPRLAEPTDIQGFSGNFSERKKLLAIGESTIAGVGVSSHREGITGHLAELLSVHWRAAVEWQVFAKSGLTAKTLNRKLQREKIDFSPDLIVVGLGGNDAFKFTSPAAWRTDLEALLATLRENFPAPPILFANLPPTAYFPAFSLLIRFFLGSLTALHRNELLAIAGHHENVFFCEKRIRPEVWPTVSNPEKELFSDGVHPSALTYRLWAGELAGFWQKQSPRNGL